MNNNRIVRYKRIISWFASIILIVSYSIPTKTFAEDLSLNTNEVPAITSEESTSSENQAAAPEEAVAGTLSEGTQEENSHIVSEGGKSFYISVRKAFANDSEPIKLDSDRHATVTIEANERNSLAKKYYFRVHPTNIESINDERDAHHGPKVEFKVDNRAVTDTHPNTSNPAFSLARHTQNFAREMFFTPKKEATVTLVVTVPEMESKPVTITVNIVDPNKAPEKISKIQQEVDGRWVDVADELSITSPYKESYKVRAVLTDGTVENVDDWEITSEGDNDPIEEVSKNNNEFIFRVLKPGKATVEAYFVSSGIKGKKKVSLNIEKDFELQYKDITKTPSWIPLKTDTFQMQKGERGNIRISKPLDEFGNPIGTLDIQPTFKLDGQIVKPRVENNQYFHVGIANNSKGREVAIRAKKDGRAVLTIEIPGQEAITINLVSGNPDAVVPEISLQSKAAESEWAALVQPWVIEEGEGQYSIKASVPEGTQGTFA